VEARASPTDALAEDDTVSVDTSSLAPVATVVDPTCPAAVLRAIRAHPALRAATASDARLVVDCGEATSVSPALPRIRVASGTPKAMDASTLRWAPGFADRWPRMAIAPSLRSRGRLEAAGPADSVLLEAGTGPLVILRQGPPRLVEISLDLSNPEGANADSLPLLVGVLVDVAMNDGLLSRSVTGGRGVLASKIGPLESLRARPESAPSVQSRRSTLLLPLLLLAMAMLLWDVGTLGRRLMRETGRPARGAQ
jgi:hypothetical protein